jgi:hypothetical protein
MIDDIIISNVGAVYAHAISQTLDIEEITALFGQQRINDRDVNVANLDETMRQVTANEAETSGD